MSRRMMTTSRLAAGAVALAFAVVSSATCLAAGLAMPRAEQHACCAAMADGCGSPKTPALEDCCAAGQPGQNGTVPVASIGLTAPAAIDAVFPPPAVPPVTFAALDPDVSRTIGPPTYLLDSVFRI